MTDISDLTNEDVVQMFKAAPQFPELHKIAEEYCYDRSICHWLNIDYNDIHEVDYMRAYLFAIENKKMMEARK